MSNLLCFDGPFPRESISEKQLEAIQPQITAAHDLLMGRSGPGSKYLGWLELPETCQSELPGIIEAADIITEQSEVLVVVGVGGSYLGSRAAIEGLAGSFHNYNKGAPKVFFAGNNLSSSYHAELIDALKDKDFSVNVISKSGTTLEPAIAFRLLRDILEHRYGREEARRRIFATTDAQGGALRTLADREGYTTFPVPADVGGRYSVLSPVGLLPIAVAGIDVASLLEGALKAREQLNSPGIEDNPCYRYAACRNIFYNQGKIVELLSAYEPCLRVFAEWWKQLFGESEGKEGKGLFPAAALFSTDLHSLGQYIQQGPRILFETVVRVQNPRYRVTIPHTDEDLDQLNYLANRSMDFVNDCAFKGTLQAHSQDGIPNLVIQMRDLSPGTFGYLFYFMEKACAISAYLLKVNPFDQPGVEEYKRKMLSLLN